MTKPSIDQLRSYSPWIGVDLDATLAYFDWDVWPGVGPPIMPMVRRVRTWLERGKDVRIFTARVSVPDDEAFQREAIGRWCEHVFGRRLPVTNIKDHGMVEIWDDKAVGVVRNRGIAKV